MFTWSIDEFRVLKERRGEWKGKKGEGKEEGYIKTIPIVLLRKILVILV